MAELMSVRQTGTVSDYIEQFELILPRLDLSDAHQFSCFVNGLKNDIKSQVRMFNPTTIQYVARLAKLYEDSKEPKPIPKPSFSSYTHPAPSKTTPILPTPKNVPQLSSKLLPNSAETK